ncbi:MAG: hypothetical protein FK730_07045 [Asgard group archaeon]|nr:hypothetical protein [Asgard group archaeon]
MSKEKPKPYLLIVIISIIFITAMSIGIFVIMSVWLQDYSTRYTETSVILNNFGDLADDDIQTILGEDSAKYESSYSHLNDLFLLNDQYIAMVEYNATHPFNYTQQDFDEIKMEFTLKMRLIISIVQSTSVYEYSAIKLGADVSNNYTYSGFEFLYIINQWYKWNDNHNTIHSDISNYVNTSFTLSGDPLDLPEIQLETWTYHLHNNLSILEFVGASKSISYIEGLIEEIDLSLVNLSLDQVFIYSDKYISLGEKMGSIIQDFNNALITLALSGVLMGFTISFEKINYRIISMFVGLIILLLAIIYFFSAFGTFLNLPSEEAAIIGPQGFVFI